MTVDITPPDDSWNPFEQNDSSWSFVEDNDHTDPNSPHNICDNIKEREEHRLEEETTRVLPTNLLPKQALWIWNIFPGA